MTDQSPSSADIDDEPDAICANCDCYASDATGRFHYCVNRLSPKYGDLRSSAEGCVKFFPDPKRWPDADHGED